MAHLSVTQATSILEKLLSGEIKMSEAKTLIRNAPDPPAGATLFLQRIRGKVYLYVYDILICFNIPPHLFTLELDFAYFLLFPMWFSGLSSGIKF
jgi:hypothetical protein